MKKYIALLLTALMVVGVFGMFSGCREWEEPPKVYYLNCVPEANEAWQKLAAAYQDLSGVEVTVRTVAAEDCRSVLVSVLAGENAPTAFQFDSAGELDVLGQYCMDLTGTKLLEQTITDRFNLTAGEAVKAVGYSYDAFGLIVNKTLLEQAGYTMENIQDFAGLQTVAEDIHARAAELGFDAFAASGLESSSAWRFTGELANVALYYELRDRAEAEEDTVSGIYLEQYRRLWDLYVTNSAADRVFLHDVTGEASLEDFGMGKAVFLPHSASVYSALMDSTYAMDPEALAIQPISCGVEGEENAGLYCGVEGYWAVNARASDADRKATLDFLQWVATSELGISVLESEFGCIPFKAANSSNNPFYAHSNTMLAEGKIPLVWTAGHMTREEPWRANAAAALVVYSANPTDPNWETVKTAFVEGWAERYGLQTVGTRKR